VEYEEEHGHADRTKRIDERPEQHYRGNYTLQNVQHIENEIPNQNSRHQNRSDQSQQGSTFERHARSMNAMRATRKRRIALGSDATLVL
jgi:hypothetical protein